MVFIEHFSVDTINATQRRYREFRTLLKRNLALFLNINSLTKHTYLRTLQTRNINMTRPEWQINHRILAQVTILPQHGQFVK